MTAFSCAETWQAAHEHEARRGWERGYPTSTMVDETFKLRPSVRKALRRFKREWCRASSYTHPVDVNMFRMDAASGLVWKLSSAYEMEQVTLRHEGAFTGSSGASSYAPAEHVITLRGRWSIITLLHEFTHSRGYGETGAVWWSVNAFRLVWPRAFAQLESTPGSHALRKRRQDQGS